MARKQKKPKNPAGSRSPDPKSNPADSKKQDSQPKLTPAQARAAKFRIAGYRETVEAIVVAFVLALLFRAFLAEAFVIPTGSMAPALMGAHKDLFCQQCQYNFPAGASCENAERPRVVVGGVCPNCRHVNSLDLANTANHATFSGDRILVNKFSYVFNDPERWDVIVFKFPGNPKQNYIKRLVGLPGETLTIKHGDVYRRDLGSDHPIEILRKPPDKLLAMSQVVHDTHHQSAQLIAAEYPSRWQPWQPGTDGIDATKNSRVPENSWKVDRTPESMTASVDASSGQQWIRYFHHFPDDRQWQLAADGGSLANVDPYDSRAITDFYPYNAYVSVPVGNVYGDGFARIPNTRIPKRSLGFNPLYRSGGPISQFGNSALFGNSSNPSSPFGKHGLHWVGDLICTADIETDTAAKQLVFELVEAGIRFECQFDLTDGKAVLSILSDRPHSFDAASPSSPVNLHPTAQTSVRAGGAHEIRFSNCDDQLLVWVDGTLQSFDQPTTFDSRSFRLLADDRPHVSANHPLDASPIGIAVSGGKATVRHAEIRRDKYYIATTEGNGNPIADYDFSGLPLIPNQNGAIDAIHRTLVSPKNWNQSLIWSARREVEFDLAEDQFFPMGDNSPQSLDARCWVEASRQRFGDLITSEQGAYRWADKQYVPRELLVGRAILVFWPHYWNAPVKFTPNFKRMKLIR